MCLQQKDPGPWLGGPTERSDVTDLTLLLNQAGGRHSVTDVHSPWKLHVVHDLTRPHVNPPLADIYEEYNARARRASPSINRTDSTTSHSSESSTESPPPIRISDVIERRDALIALRDLTLEHKKCSREDSSVTIDVAPDCPGIKTYLRWRFPGYDFFSANHVELKLHDITIASGILSQEADGREQIHRDSVYRIIAEWEQRRARAHHVPGIHYPFEVRAGRASKFTVTYKIAEWPADHVILTEEIRNFSLVRRRTSIDWGQELGGPGNVPVDHEPQHAVPLPGPLMRHRRHS